jgi:hypothetical protein
MNVARLHGELLSMETTDPVLVARDRAELPLIERVRGARGLSPHRLQATTSSKRLRFQ